MTIVKKYWIDIDPVDVNEYLNIRINHSVRCCLTVRSMD